MIFDLVLTEVGNDPKGNFETLYVAFNWFEAFGWFVFSLFVWWRYLKNRRTKLELIYGLYFLLFGITDVVEVYKLTLGLFATKAIVLLSILVCRYYVVLAYRDKGYKI